MPLRAALPVLALTLVASCTPKPNYLFVEPRDGTVRVELRTTAGLFVREERPVALDDCGFFSVFDEEDGMRPPQEIWRVMAIAPDAMTLAVRYGNTPAGFTQVTPPGSAPPPLEPGGRYVVECTGDAIGATEFRMPE